MTGDFAHRLTLDRIGDGERLDLVADEAERAAIADRLGLLALHRLDAHAVLRRGAGGDIGVEGRLKASLDQACVATGEPVEAHIDEPFKLRFVPEPSGFQPDEEIELAADDLDTIFHDGASIDLGLAIADSLALTLDPYPRSPDAESALKAAGVKREDEVGPFASLAALKARMAGEGEA